MSDEAPAIISDAIKGCTVGEATVDPAMPLPDFGGRKFVVVGILGRKTCIAVCGPEGDAESLANAVRIAHDWNKRQ